MQMFVCIFYPVSSFLTLINVWKTFPNISNYISLCRVDSGTVTPTETPGVSSVQQVQKPECFVAVYPYTSSEPGDLSFAQGDVISVTKQDGDWWTGNLDGNTGIFPANYVKKADSMVSE